MVDDNQSAKDFAAAVENFKSASSENFKVNRSFAQDIKQFDLGTKTLDKVARFMQAEQVLQAFRATKEFLTRRKRERQEMKQLRESLGISKKEFELLAAQKKTNDAFAASQQKLNDAATNLLGFSGDFVDILSKKGDENTKGLIKEITKQRDALIETGDKNNMLLKAQQATAMNALRLQEKSEGTLAARQEEEMKAKFAENKRTSLLESIADGIVDLNKSFLKGLVDKGKSGLQIALALVAAPIIALAAFFKQLATEFVFLTKIAKGGFKLAIAPIKGIINLFNAINPFKGAIAKGRLPQLLASLKNTKFISELINFARFYFVTIPSKIKGLGLSAITKIAPKISSVISTIGKFFAPIGRFFTTIMGLGKTLLTASTTASKILGFAKGFGTFLGKIFIPFTILIEGVRFIMNFIEGFQEGGIFEGLKRGIEGLFDNIITAPINFLKDIVSGILKFFGADAASAALDSVEFPKLGEIVDAASNFIKSLLKKILPNPKGNFIARLASKAIPDAVYRFAGINPKTGEELPIPPAKLPVVGPEPKSLTKPVSGEDTQSKKVAEEKNARAALDASIKEAAEKQKSGPPQINAPTSNVNASTTNNNKKVITPKSLAVVNPTTRAAIRSAIT